MSTKKRHGSMCRATCSCKTTKRDHAGPSPMSTKKPRTARDSLIGARYRVVAPKPPAPSARTDSAPAFEAWFRDSHAAWEEPFAHEVFQAGWDAARASEDSKDRELAEYRRKTIESCAADYLQELEDGLAAKDQEIERLRKVLRRARRELDLYSRNRQGGLIAEVAEIIAEIDALALGVSHG